MPVQQEWFSELASAETNIIVLRPAMCLTDVNQTPIDDFERFRACFGGSSKGR